MRGAPVFVWDATDAGGHEVSGVTRTWGDAMKALLKALGDMPEPGAEGKIRSAWPNPLSRYPAYMYGGVVMRGRRDLRTGALVFEGAGVARA